VFAKERLDEARLEDPGSFEAARRELLVDGVGEIAVYPTRDRNAEAFLGAADDSRREHATDSLLQRMFAAESAYLARRRELVEKRHQSRIEKRRANFQGVGHAGTIYFEKNVVGKVKVGVVANQSVKPRRFVAVGFRKSVQAVERVEGSNCLHYLRLEQAPELVGLKRAQPELRARRIVVVRTTQELTQLEIEAEIFHRCGKVIDRAFCGPA